MTKVKFKEFYGLEMKVDELQVNLNMAMQKIDDLKTKAENNRLNIKKILDWLGLDSWQEAIRKKTVGKEEEFKLDKGE